MAQTTNTSDNSGMGVIAGILIAVLLVVGGYFFIQGRDTAGTGRDVAVNIETPSNAEPAAGNAAPQTPTSNAPAPAAQ